MSARSRAYPWWRHMDPENGLIALARIGDAIMRARSEEAWAAMGGSTLDGIDTTSEYQAKSWDQGADLVADLEAMVQRMREEVRNPPRDRYPMPVVKTTTVPLQGRKWVADADEDGYEEEVWVDVLCWNIFGTIYVHPDRWDAFVAAVGDGSVQPTPGRADRIGEII